MKVAGWALPAPLWDLPHPRGLSCQAGQTQKGCFDMQHAQRLCDLAPGQRGVVRELETAGPMRRRLLDIGLVGGTPVECLGRSPGGDPAAYLIRGAVIAIRREDCAGVVLRGQ